MNRSLSGSLIKGNAERSADRGRLARQILRYSHRGVRDMDHGQRRLMTECAKDYRHYVSGRSTLRTVWVNAKRGVSNEGHREPRRNNQ